MQNIPTNPSNSINQNNFLGFSRSNPSTPVLMPVDLHLDDAERFSLYDSIPAISDAVPATPDPLLNTYNLLRPVLRHHRCYLNHGNRGRRPFASRNMAYC